MNALFWMSSLSNLYILHSVLTSSTYWMSVMRSKPVVCCCLGGGVGRGSVVGGLMGNLLSCIEIGMCALILKVALAFASIESL